MLSSLHLTLKFLRDLRDNNNREWFNANRARYEAARSAHEDFIAALIQSFDRVDDLGGLTPGEATFRINRDVRFSTDKSPYKIGMGALLGKGGRKSTGRSYYIHIEPGDKSYLGGGVYMPEPKDLERIRGAIAEDARPLRAILAADSFTHYFGEMGGEQLKTTPKGYDKNHPDIDLLRYKQFLAGQTLTDAQLVSFNLVDHVLEVFKALKPFVAYFGEITERR